MMGPRTLLGVVAWKAYANALRRGFGGAGSDRGSSGGKMRLTAMRALLVSIMVQLI